MTNAEWRSCNDPAPMLAYLGDSASDRKVRLFAVACCRRAWPLISRESREAVDCAELFADGLETSQHLDRFCRKAFEPVIYLSIDTDELVTSAHAAAWVTCLPSLRAQANIARMGMRGREEATELAIRADLLRCIFGDQCSLPPAHSSWLTWNAGSVVHLAQAIYDERAFDRMPILADALEDAGCTNQDILEHCRGGGEHVRGCWVVDLVLGKS